MAAPLPSSCGFIAARRPFEGAERLERGPYYFFATREAAELWGDPRVWETRPLTPPPADQKQRSAAGDLHVLLCSGRLLKSPCGGVRAFPSAGAALREAGRRQKRAARVEHSCLSRPSQYRALPLPPPRSRSTSGSKVGGARLDELEQGIAARAGAGRRRCTSLPAGLGSPAPCSSLNRGGGASSARRAERALERVKRPHLGRKSGRAAPKKKSRPASVSSLGALVSKSATAATPDGS
jgi:hypothetical protein